MQRSHRLVHIVLVLVAVCACGTLHGQTQNGSINGTVKDASGAVAGAQIVLQPTGTTVASNAQGDFRFRTSSRGSTQSPSPTWVFKFRLHGYRDGRADSVAECNDVSRLGQRAGRGDGEPAG